MEILQLKSKDDFLQANPKKGTILLFPQLNDGNIIFYIKDQNGNIQEVGTGFGQYINIQNGTQKYSPFLEKIENNIVLSIKDEGGNVQQLTGNQQITPVVLTKINDNGTCSVAKIKMEIINGQVITNYTGQIVNDVIYQWNQPEKKDILLNISGFSEEIVNNSYKLKEEYSFGLQRQWFNQEDSRYFIKWSLFEKRWELYYLDELKSYQTTGNLQPYDSNSIWNNDVIVNLV